MTRGRPHKLTLDFFVHDCKASGSDKIRLLSRRHGNDGYATFFRMLEILCQQDGLQLDLSSSLVAELKAEDCHLRDAQHLFSIIESCVEFGLFDRQLWESERIVLCPGLYKRYIGRLEERQKTAERKKRQREAGQLAERISEVQETFPGDKKIVTPEKAIVTRDNPPEIRDQNTEIRDQSREKELTNSSSSSSNAQGSEQAQTAAAAAEVKTDPFFGQTGRRVVYLSERQRWDAKAPWQTDEQRLEFESWLKARYSGKEQPSRYAAAIICAAAEGKPCPDWDEFSSGVVAEVAAIDQQDPSKIDWANHPNRDRWLKELHELGMRQFSTRPDGQIDQARAFFKHWAKQEGLVNYG